MRTAILSNLPRVAIPTVQPNNSKENHMRITYNHITEIFYLIAQDGTILFFSNTIEEAKAFQNQIEDKFVWTL